MIPKVAVIIPTRNRRESLLKLLKSLKYQLLLPVVVLVVDSSDEIICPSDYNFEKNIKILVSNRKSAAHQRNLGIRTILTEYPFIDFVSFLDDDVEISSDYLRRSISQLVEHIDVVGVSGIARATNNIYSSKSLVSRLVLARHKAGSISKSLINISPCSLKEISYVDWLIGCSSWKRAVFNYTLFEDDFEGQSLFEDVIFSYRASRIGKLIVDPSIEIQHNLSSEGRPNTRIHYESWVVNRARLFQYSDTEFSRIAYLMTILFVIFKYLPSALLARNEAREKILGVFSGFVKIVS